MRYLLAFLSIFSLSVICADAALAQETAKPLKNRQILRQDSDECAKEVSDPHRVDLFSACMTKKQMARKEEAKQKKGGASGKTPAGAHRAFRGRRAGQPRGQSATNGAGICRP